MTAEAAADAATTEGRHSDYKEDDNKHVDNDDYPQWQWRKSATTTMTMPTKEGAMGSSPSPLVTLHLKIGGVPLWLGTVNGGSRAPGDGEVEDNDNGLEDGGPASMINNEDGQAEKATRVRDDGMACANLPSSSPSSVTAASEWWGILESNINSKCIGTIFMSYSSSITRECTSGTFVTRVTLDTS